MQGITRAGAAARRAARIMAARSPMAMQRAGLHLGRASADETLAFVRRGSAGAESAQLRTGATSHVHISRRGVGSSHLWAKDVPRIDASKATLTGYDSNFIQASINPYIEEPANADTKQSFVESLVVQEAIEDEGIHREGLVLSAVLEDSLVRPALTDPSVRLSSAYIDKGVKIALDELNVEALDHVILRVPDELFQSELHRSQLHEALIQAADALDSLCGANKIQSYGFALPAFNEANVNVLDRLLEASFLPLSEQHGNFASLQVAMPLTSSMVPLPRSLKEFKDSRKLTLIADRVFEASLSNGKPLTLRTYLPHLGEDIALLLKSAFNLAISIERKYMEKLLPANTADRILPAAEDVAWAHILANQHAQFDNLEEWTYIYETQILPRFEVTVRQFDPYEDLKDFGFAYSMAMRELFKCFTASVELADSGRVSSMVTALQEQGLLVHENEPLEHVAVKAALSGGADAVLFQEQLGKQPAIALDALYSPSQLAQIQQLTHPFFIVE